MSTRTNTALITGSSSGIGLDIARAFLDKGSNVILNGRDEGKLTRAAEQLGPPDRIGVVAGNIGDRETGEAMVRVAVERLRPRGEAGCRLSQGIRARGPCWSHL